MWGNDRFELGCATEVREASSIPVRTGACIYSPATVRWVNPAECRAGCPGLRSNETWLKIDYGQLHIRIKSMWLRRVYFVLLKFLRAKIVAPKRQAVSRHCGT